MVNGDLLISKSNTLSLLLYHWPGGLGITRFPVFNRVKHLYCITQALIKRKASQLAALKSAFAHPAISPRIYHKQEHGIVHEYSLFNLFQQSADTTYDASFCLLYFEQKPCNSIYMLLEKDVREPISHEIITKT